MYIISFFILFTVRMIFFCCMKHILPQISPHHCGSFFALIWQCWFSNCVITFLFVCLDINDQWWLDNLRRWNNWIIHTLRGFSCLFDILFVELLAHFMFYRNTLNDCQCNSVFIWTPYPHATNIPPPPISFLDWGSLRTQIQMDSCWWLLQKGCLNACNALFLPHTVLA